MKQFKGVGLFKFLQTFPSENECKEYLYNLKFTPNFACSKCKHTEFYKGVQPYTKVCKKCRFIESASSNTLFNKVKFGLRKALCIVYDMTTIAGGISAKQEAAKYEINYNTAWMFMKKVRIAMKSSGQHPMTGKVSVDDFLYGGYEAGVVGRSAKTKKIQAIIAVEVTNNNKIKRVYAMTVKSHHTAEFRKIFDKHISKDSTVHLDKHKSYMPLQKEYDIVRDLKNKKNSPANSQIQQLKSWLRHVHKHISHYHADTYFNEYSFRINRSQSKDSIVHKCIERMVKAEKLSWKQITQKNKCMNRNEFVERIKLYRSMGAKYKISGGRILLVA